MQTPNNRSERTRKNTSPLPPIKISVHRHEVRENNLDSGLWFVLEGRKALSLLPVRSSDTQGFKNLLQNPSIRIDARGVEPEFRAVFIADTKMVKSVVENRREK